MTAALIEAYRGCSHHEGGPFGCCIVRENKILSQTHNTVLKDKDPTAHAEVNAIRKASRLLKTYNLKGCIIYTTTEPCPMCFSSIYWAKINYVVYGTLIKDAAKLGFGELCIKAERMNKLGKANLKITGKFMYNECGKLLDFWQKLSIKEVY